MVYFFLFMTVVANVMMVVGEGFHEMMVSSPGEFWTGAILNNVIMVVCFLVVRSHFRALRESDI